VEIGAGGGRTEREGGGGESERGEGDRVERGEGVQSTRSEVGRGGRGGRSRGGGGRVIGERAEGASGGVGGGEEGGWEKGWEGWAGCRQRRRRQWAEGKGARGLGEMGRKCGREGGAEVEEVVIEGESRVRVEEGNGGVGLQSPEASGEWGRKGRGEGVETKAGPGRW